MDGFLLVWTSKLKVLIDDHGLYMKNMTKELAQKFMKHIVDWKPCASETFMNFLQLQPQRDLSCLAEAE